MPSREQHPKLWFLDGDLVLCAPVTSGQQRVYRIHRFIVTQNSPVLGEHLEAVEKKIDVELIVQDNAELIDILLSFWYNPLCVRFPALEGFTILTNTQVPPIQAFRFQEHSSVPPATVPLYQLQNYFTANSYHPVPRRRVALKLGLLGSARTSSKRTCSPTPTCRC